MMYGMGPGLLAKNLECTIEEANKIVNDFYTGFPDVQKWIKKTEADAMINGYVEDFWGRRRRLPDLLLPKVEVKYSKFNKQDFNPILGAESKYINNDTDEIKLYKNRALKCETKKEFDFLKNEAGKNGIYIKDNNGFISTAQRQCVNARIQGGAATMTKKAMIAISNDSEMKRLDFKILIGVHDELIGECPIVNSQEVADRLSLLMRTAVPELPVPFKCDAEIEEHWYESDYSHSIQDQYKKYLNNNSEEEAFRLICEDHSESLPEDLKIMLESSD